MPRHRLLGARAGRVGRAGGTSPLLDEGNVRNRKAEDRFTLLSPAVPGKEPLMRARLLIALCSLLVLAIPAAGGAAERMLIGFQDDPSFRWRDDRATVLDIAQQLDATI